MSKSGKGGLGRGLSALISTPPVSVTPRSFEQRAEVLPAGNTDVIPTQLNGLQYVPLTKLVPNPKQPRTDFSEAEIRELSESIRILGIIQPIVVRRVGTGESERHEIVAGERRFRAATLAGLQSVPVLIRDLSDRDALEIALVENVQRQNLNPVEEAYAYQRLMDEFSLIASEVATRVGKDRSTVSNAVRLLKLPQFALDVLRSGQISVGHAKAILTARDPAVQVNLAKKVIDEGLSVRTLEGIVQRQVVLDPPKESDRKNSTPQSGEASPYPELEDKLRNALGTKVTISRMKRGDGVIELHFYSEAELDRLTEQLTTPIPRG